MGEQDELMQIFLAECRENIDFLDEEIVKLETDPNNRELLDEIFRAFHTLKGNAGIVGMNRFGTLSHVTEEILTEIRDGKREINSEVINFLLDSLDQLKILHKAMEETGSDQLEVEEPSEKSAVRTIQSPPSCDAKSAATPEQKISSDKAEKVAREKNAAKPGSEDVESPPGEEKKEESKKKADHSAAQKVTPPQSEKTEGLPDSAVEKQIKKKTYPKSGQADSSAANQTKQTEIINEWHQGDSSIRVDVSVLDRLMEFVGELVLSRNQILQFSEHLSDANFNSTCQRFNSITNDLQEIVMKARMQTIGSVFCRFPRVVRDIARQNNKKVQLKLEGQDTELDKTIIDAIRDPLTHLVRNAIDHGIEDEQTRIKAGKSPEGTLILKAYHDGGQVILEIIDDGAGIDHQKIRQKVVEKGLLTDEQAEMLSENEAQELIFLPGFSTSAQVTNISGRGVGMDVVKTNIHKIGGRIEISSKPTLGTTIKIDLPLTMSIIDGLQVTIAGKRYVIPLSFVVECIEQHRDNERDRSDRRVIILRDTFIPYIRLREWFRISGKPPEVEQMVITEVGGHRIGLVVDEVIGHYQTVIKSLGKIYKDVEGVSGTTILGDGTIALILDIQKLVEYAVRQEQALNQKIKYI